MEVNSGQINISFTSQECSARKKCVYSSVTLMIQLQKSNSKNTSKLALNMNDASLDNKNESLLIKKENKYQILMNGWL